MGVRTKIGIGVAVLLAAILLFCAGQQRRIKQLSAERDRYAGNTAALLADVERYRVGDSLNAARVQSLELTVKEYERFRADDAALIKQLKQRNRDLERVSATQMQTITELSIVPRDTIIIRDSVPIPALHLTAGDEWYNFDGLLAAGHFSGTMVNRDSLVIAETVKYRRFLRILWKTRRVQDRQLDVVSKNPHTVIMGTEYIIIEK